MKRIDNRLEIRELLEDKSLTLIDLIDNNKSANYVLFSKYITHSDILTSMKATKKNSLVSNLLYYLTLKEMEEIEQQMKKLFKLLTNQILVCPKLFFQIF